MLTWREAEEIQEHWRAEPPVGPLLRAYFDIGVQSQAITTKRGPIEISEQQFAALRAAMGEDVRKYGRRN